MKIQLVEDWRKWWQMHSLYVFVFIGALPDIWNLVVESGLLDDTAIGQHLNVTIKVCALVGAVARLIKTRAAALPTDPA